MTVQFVSKPPERRVMRVDLRVDMFLRMLQGMDGKKRVRCDGLPSDVRQVGIDYSIAWDTITLYLESPSFEPVPEGASPPNLEVRFTEFLSVEAVADTLTALARSTAT